MTDRSRSLKSPWGADRRSPSRPFPELCAEGLQDAARALERFLDASRAALTIDEAGLWTSAELLERLGPERSLVVVGFDVGGEVKGPFVQILDASSADKLADMLLGRAGEGTRSEQESSGALAEVGNIAASAFLNRLANHLRGPCLPSVPRMLRGEARSVVPTALGAGAPALTSLACRFGGVPLWLCAAATPVSAEERDRRHG